MLESIKEHKNWIVWKLLDGKKLPFGLEGTPGIDAGRGTYEEALASFERGGLTGIGPVFEQSFPFVFIDIDGYDDRFLVQKNLLRLFANKSYIERSQSGTGYHIIARVDDKGEFRQIKSDKFEMYFDRRFCAMPLPHKDYEQEGSCGLDHVHENECGDLFRKVYRALNFLVRSEENISELLDLLQRGSIKHFDSPSEYDYALAKVILKYTPDHETVQGIMMLSESDLVRIERGKAPKCDREDYVKNTIKKINSQWDELIVNGSFDYEAWKKGDILKIGENPIVRRSEITLVRGLTKQGKGHFCLSIAAAIFDGDESFGATRGETAESLIYFDTEMGHERSKKMREMFLRKVGRDPGNKAIFVSIQNKSYEERLQIISKFTRDFRPSMIIIDGARDLLKDFNSIEQGYVVLQELNRIATSNDCAILTTLHVNPTGEVKKARGHFGTELEQKAIATIHLEKDEKDSDTVTVSCPFGRDGGFDTFQIKWSSEKRYFVKVGSDTPF